MKVILPVLILAIVGMVRSDIQGLITNDPKTVNSKTKLVFDINQWAGASRLSAGSYFEVTFPAADFASYFNQFATSEAALPASDCTTSFGFSTQETLQCKVFKLQNKVQVKLTKDSVWTYVGFVIGNVMNPDSARRSGIFQISIFDPTSKLIDTSGSNSQFVIKSEADQIQMIQVTNSNKTVGGYGELTVKLTPKHEVSVSGDIVFSFPKWDAASEEQTKRASYFKDQKCQLVFNLASTISKSATCEILILPNEDRVSIKKCLTPEMKGGDPIVFTVSEVRNAPTLKGALISKVQTQKSDGTAIEEASDIEYKPLVVASVPPNFYQPSFAQNQVSTLTEFFMRIKFLNPVPANSVIRITFPPEVLITDPTGQQSYLNSVKLGITFLKFNILASSGTAKDTVLINDAISSYQEPQTTLNLQLSKVKTPLSSAVTKSFKVSIEAFDGKNFYPIESATEGVTIQTQAQALPSIDFRTTNYEVFQGFNATFSTLFNGIIKTEDTIELIYPDSLTLNPKYIQSLATPVRAVCQAIIGGIAYSPSCTLTTQSRQFIFSQISPIRLDFTSTTNGVLVQLILVDTFLNPSSSKPIKVEAKINIRDQNGSNIAYYDYMTAGQTIEYKAEPAEVQQFKVLAKNEVTGQSGRYQVEFTVREGQKFNSGFVLEVLMPPQIKIPQNAVFKCFKGLNIDTDPECSDISAQGSTAAVKVKLVNQNTLISPGQTYKFEIDSLQNPWSTKTTDSFKIKVQTSDGFDIVTQSQGVTLAVNKPSEFQSIQIERVSKVNGAFTHFTFKIQMANQVENEAKLTINLPEDLNVKTLDGTFVECAGMGLLKTSLECKLSNRKIEISLALQAASAIRPSETIVFNLYNVQNPLSLAPSRSLEYELKTKDRLFLISRVTTGQSIQNSEVPSMTDSEIIALNPQLNQESTYSIQFLPAIPLIADAVIKIQMPQKLTRSQNSTVTCSEQLSLKRDLDCKYEQLPHQVIIYTKLTRSQLNQNKLVLHITGFVNPNEPTFSESFKIRIYDNQENLSQQILEGLSFTKSCDFPCLTCGLSKKTCLSCQLDSMYPFLFNVTCLDKCPPGFYGNSSFQCDRCSSECATCDNTANNCTSCSNKLDFWHQKSGKCLKECPDGQYTDFKSFQCKDCPQNCTKCSGIDTCTSCSDGFFYFANKCYQTCPKMMIPSPDLKFCKQCMPPCKECEGTVDQCLSCDQTSKFKFLFGFTCLEECPHNYSPTGSDGYTCELVKEDVVPFVFLLLAFLASLGIGIAKIFKRKIHYKNTQIGIISSICLANWIFLIYLTVKDHMWQSTVVLLYGLCSSYILNAIFFCLYLKVMRQDEYYNKWRETRVKRETVLVIAALLTSFQLYRIAFQQLSKVIKLHKEEKEGEQAEGGASEGQAKKQGVNRVQPVQNSEVGEAFYKFADENSVKSIFNKLTIVMISCVLVPVLIQNIYNLNFTAPGRQLFWTDIESICITGYLLVLMIFDVYKKTKKIDLASLKPGKGQMVQFNQPNNQVSRTEASRGSFRRSLDSSAISQLFNNTQELKRFREILSKAINRRERPGSVSRSERDSEWGRENRIESGDDLPFQKPQRNLPKLNEITAVSAFELQSKQNDRSGRKKTLRQLDMTRLTQNTEEMNMTSDRNITSDRFLMRGDVSNREMPGLMISKYKSPIIEESHRHASTLSPDENIMSTLQENENISGENSPDRNRQNINGMVDPLMLSQLEVKGKISSGENFRDTVKATRFNIQGLSDKKSFLAGRSENEELVFIQMDQPSNAEEHKMEDMPPSHFSIMSPKGDRPSESMEQREGGQVQTVQTSEKHLKILNSTQQTNPTPISSPNFVKRRGSTEEEDLPASDSNKETAKRALAQKLSQQSSNYEKPDQITADVKVNGMDGNDSSLKLILADHHANFELEEPDLKKNENRRSTLEEIEKFVLQNSSIREKQSLNQGDLQSVLFEHQNTMKEIESFAYTHNPNSNQDGPNMQKLASSVSDKNHHNSNFLKISMIDRENFPVMLSPGFRMAHDSNPAERDLSSAEKNRQNFGDMDDKTHQTQGAKKDSLQLQTHACEYIVSSSNQTNGREGRSKSSITEQNLTRVLNQVQSQHSSKFNELDDIASNLLDGGLMSFQQQNEKIEAAQFQIKEMKHKPQKQEIEEPKQAQPVMAKEDSPVKDPNQISLWPTGEESQNPSHDEIKLLNSNLKNFGANNSNRNNRADFINSKNGTTQKKNESQALHRTNTSMTDEANDNNLEEADVSKDRPVTALQDDGIRKKARQNIFMKNQIAINEANWLDKMQIESNAENEVNESPVRDEIETPVAPPRVVMQHTKETDEDHSIGFYNQRTDEKSRISGSIMGASIYAKSFSPVKRIQQQKQMQENLERQRQSILQQINNPNIQTYQVPEHTNSMKNSTSSNQAASHFGRPQVNQIKVNNLGSESLSNASRVIRNRSVSPIGGQKGETPNIANMNSNTRSQARGAPSDYGGHTHLHRHHCQKSDNQNDFQSNYSKFMAERPHPQTNNGHSILQIQDPSITVKLAQPKPASRSVTPLGMKLVSSPDRGDGDFLDQQISHFEVQARQGLRHYPDNLSARDSAINGGRALSQFGKSSYDGGSRPPSSKIGIKQNAEFLKKSANYRAGAAIIGHNELDSNHGSERSRRFEIVNSNHASRTRQGIAGMGTLNSHNNMASVTRSAINSNYNF